MQESAHPGGGGGGEVEGGGAGDEWKVMIGRGKGTIMSACNGFCYVYCYFYILAFMGVGRRGMVCECVRVRG
jgi:hypothetical protein